MRSPEKSENQLGPSIIFLSAILSFFWLLACSSDLVDSLTPSKAPVITRIEASSYEVDQGDTVAVHVIVGEANGDVLKYAWSCTSGRFIPPTDDVSAQWVAPAQGGTVTIKIKVSNEDKSSDASIQITVKSYIKPQVEILAPKWGEYIVQNSLVTIQAGASHTNGIRRVDFFVGDSLYSPTDFTGDTYRLQHRFDHPAGPLWIKVMATANVTGAVDVDSIQVHVEGIIVGKARR
ncbi:hypothetical protein EH221_01230 [bacterium]|nr:MAG: hypothetical protein EH221_01230 [bacterium]